jgi:hypothetical protein
MAFMRARVRFVDGAVSHSRVRTPGMHAGKESATACVAFVSPPELIDRAGCSAAAVSRGRRAYSWHASTSERGRGGLVTHNRDGSNHDTPGG